MKGSKACFNVAEGKDTAFKTYFHHAQKIWCFTSYCLDIGDQVDDIESQEGDTINKSISIKLKFYQYYQFHWS